MSYIVLGLVAVMVIEGLGIFVLAKVCKRKDREIADAKLDAEAWRSMYDHLDARLERVIGIQNELKKVKDEKVDIPTDNQSLVDKLR